MVVLVGLEVLGELVDAVREHRNLHLRRAGVTFTGTEVANNLGLGGLVERHFLPNCPGWSGPHPGVEQARGTSPVTPAWLHRNRPLTTPFTRSGVRPSHSPGPSL